MTANQTPAPPDAPVPHVLDKAARVLWALCGIAVGLLGLLFGLAIVQALW